MKQRRNSLGLTSSVIIPSESQSESTAGVVVELALGVVCDGASSTSRDLLLLVTSSYLVVLFKNIVTLV